MLCIRGWNTDYKYVVFFVNDIREKAVETMFYVKDSKGNIFYSPYTNNSRLTYNICSMNGAVLQN